MCFYLAMNNGWQMPGQAHSAAMEWRRSTGRSQVCAVPPLQSSEGPHSLTVRAFRMCASRTRRRPRSGRASLQR
jgi:hypothetical protein